MNGPAFLGERRPEDAARAEAAIQAPVRSVSSHEDLPVARTRGGLPGHHDLPSAHDGRVVGNGRRARDRGGHPPAPAAERRVGARPLGRRTRRERAGHKTRGERDGGDSARYGMIAKPAR